MSHDRRSRTPLSLEKLEGKQLLSTVSALVATARPFSIDGKLRAPISSIQTYQTDGQHFGVFAASGRLKSTGRVQASFVATLDSTDTVMTSGRMTLSNRRGSVVLDLAIDPSDSASYVFNVSTATGSFKDAIGSGKITTGAISNSFKVMTFTIHTNKL